MVRNEREPLLWHRVKKEVRRLSAGNLEIFNKLRGLFVRNLSIRGLYLRFLAGRITFVNALCADGYRVVRFDFKGQAIIRSNTN